MRENVFLAKGRDWERGSGSLPVMAHIMPPARSSCFALFALRHSGTVMDTKRLSAEGGFASCPTDFLMAAQALIVLSLPPDLQATRPCP